MMLFQILKKDLMKRKGVNLILFLFITLATVFLASSVNNIFVVNSAIDYYMDYANVPDLNILTNSEAEKENIDQFLNEQMQDGTIVDYGYNYMYIVSEKLIQVQQGENKTGIASDGISLYLGAMDADYAKVFNQNGESFELQPGEIALSRTIMELNDLVIDDSVLITLNGEEKEYRIKVMVKDASYGNQMVGMTRLLLSEQDFQQYTDKLDRFGLYYVNTNDIIGFQDDLVSQQYSTILNTVSKDLYKMIYSFDLIMAGLLIAIGVCLILIAMLVLQFTLVFTMEEQYQEIGILKAIGLRDFAIKRQYLIKYLVIVCCGSLLGLLVSVPISDMMIKSVSINMILEHSDANFGLNILCAIFIVCFVVLYCYICTRRLHKVSAIQAIRGGSNGERYHKRGIQLAKRMHLPLSIYLGVNDIVTHLRRYIALIITFCICFILITIPLNTVNTMNSSEMMRKFSLDPASAVYVNSLEGTNENKYTSLISLDDGIKRLDQEMKALGYNAEYTAVPFYFINYGNVGEPLDTKILSTQVLGSHNDYLDYEEGSAPMLENEIAFSSAIMKDHTWKVGDSISASINGVRKDLIISGSYSDYMQLGMSARLNPIVDSDQEIMMDYSNVMVYLDTTLSQSELAQQLNRELSEYKWFDGQEVVDQSIGGIKSMLQQLLVPMTAMLCGVIMLITLLMERLFITREKSEIAMLKSTGFTHKAVRNWQIMRMVCVLITAMVISFLLLTLSNTFILQPIFAIMGASVEIQVDALQVYVLYPGILLAAILVATWIATRSIRNIDIREMNNLE